MTFIITNLGKKYRVGVRGSYQHRITSERKLVNALRKAADSKPEPLKARYHQLIDEGRILTICADFGILSTSVPINR